MADASLGISFQKGRVRYTHLTKKGGVIAYDYHGQIKYDPDIDLEDLVDRWRLDFHELINSRKPKMIAACETLESDTRDAARCQILPLGILALCCKKDEVKFVTYPPQSFIQPGPFGLPKGTKPKNEVDVTIGSYPPNWDDMQRKSVLAAWRSLR